jgi:hypothetical protein
MSSAIPRFGPWLCALLLVASGCATAPPVQEMSDARQAIAAAREAGAASYDATGLRQAEEQLAQAEAQLQQRVYWDARRLAVDAKESALAALLRSRSLREQEAAPPARQAP